MQGPGGDARQRNADAAPPRYGKRMRRRLAGCLATAQMASCLFPPKTSDVPTNLPLAEDIEKNPTVFGELLRGEAPIRKLHECDASGPGVLGAPAYAIDATVLARWRATQVPSLSQREELCTTCWVGHSKAPAAAGPRRLTEG